jgi:hypothetical protein
MKRLVVAVCTAAIVLAGLPLPIAAEDPPKPKLDCTASALYCPVSSSAKLAAELEAFPVPKLQGPIVLPTVTYDVTTRGTITANFADFKAKVAETYADSRGWGRLGVQFKEVASGGRYTVVLSEASQVPTFGSPCDSTYSCRVGRYVIINQDRWQNATPAWNSGKGSLRDYRHMVVNHETGHWLGLPHRNCGGAGQLAPVMQQQSINLQGCKFNPWPLDSEMRSPRLGI